jgi:signal transduction histidine kinase
MIDALTEQAALIALDGTILTINDAWRRLIVEAGFEAAGPNRNYFRFVEHLVAAGHKAGPAIQKGLSELLAGERSRFTLSYRGFGPMAGRHFKMVIASIRFGGDEYLFVTRDDVTELLDLKRQRRRLDSQFRGVQQAERRRVARDLRASTSQMLLGIQSSLSQLTEGADRPGAADILADCSETLAALQQEILSSSIQAHLSALDRHGLVTALEEMATDFAARTGLWVETQLAELASPIPLVEETLYRLAQEALSNIHRHADAKKVWLSLGETPRFIRLAIHDDGKSLQRGSGKNAPSPGVGMTGMQERVARIGGRLALRPAWHGTLMIAVLPRDASDR